MDLSDQHRELSLFVQQRVKDPTLAEDIVQEAYLAMYEQQSAGTTIENEAAYLKVTARSKMIDALRHEARHDQLEEELASMDSKQMEQLVLAHRAALTPRQWAAYCFVMLEGLTHEEAGSEMDISERAVGRLVGRAVKRIKQGGL